MILQLLQKNDSFQVLCGDYQQCADALAHWTRSTAEEAVLRKKEYAELLEELEQEIVDYLEKDGL